MTDTSVYTLAGAPVVPTTETYKHTHMCIARLVHKYQVCVCVFVRRRHKLNFKHSAKRSSSAV